VRQQTRDRLLLPVLLPIGILAAIALALWGFSRILLGIEGAAATAVALVVAAAIVLVASLAAARPQVRGSTIGAMVGATAGIAMLAGGIALAVVSGGEEGPGPEPGPEGPVVSLVAVNIAFDPTSLTVPAGEPFTIAFDNQDAGVQHNVDIFDNQELSGTAAFEGELITGVAQIDYAVGPLEPGPYFFRCVVHPNMVGEMEAAEGGGGEPGGGGGPGGGGEPGAAVVAQNLAFDTATIDLPADAPSKLPLDNRDAGVPHNISIYADESLSETLFEGELITGPAEIVYDIPPLPAGEYYFHCDVHPNMNGAVIVDAAGGGPASTDATGATGATPG
jgi:plastocyanin